MCNSFRVDRENQPNLHYLCKAGRRERCTCNYLSVTVDFSWHVVAGGKKLSSTSELLSAMPQPVSCVRDVLLVIKFLDSLVPCCGNNDKKFLPEMVPFQALQVKTWCLFGFHLYMYIHVHVHACQCVLHVLHVSIQL